MNTTVRRTLAEAATNVQIREVLTLLYRDHPQGASFAGIKEMLFLHEDFAEDRLQRLVADNVLVFDGNRYKVSADARQVLDRDPTILMDEFLR